MSHVVYYLYIYVHRLSYKSLFGSSVANSLHSIPHGVGSPGDHAHSHHALHLFHHLTEVAVFFFRQRATDYLQE